MRYVAAIIGRVMKKRKSFRADVMIIRDKLPRDLRPMSEIKARH